MAKNNPQFSRCQLNIAPYDIDKDELPLPKTTIKLPSNIKEVIVQRKPEKILQPFWLRLYDPVNVEVSVLVDGSGGQGIESSFGTVKYADDVRRIGFAGGINPENFKIKWAEAIKLAPHGNFWLDMESGVRTDDKFDLDKVEQVLEVYDSIINKK